MRHPLDNNEPKIKVAAPAASVNPLAIVIGAIVLFVGVKLLLVISAGGM